MVQVILFVSLNNRGVPYHKAILAVLYLFDKDYQKL